MEIVRILLTIVFIIVCLALIGIVLLQEGKTAGLGAVAGAAVGAVASADDIKMAVAQKKSLNQQKKLLKAYEENFTDEGVPVDAKADLSKIKNLDLAEDNSLSMSSEELKKELESEAFNTTDDSAWDI